MRLHVAPKGLIDELEATGISYELLPHSRTLSATAEAAALHVAPHEVGKTIILGTPAGLVRAVVPASKRLDLQKVRAFLRENKVELLSEEALAGAYPEFELGAVPPVGGSRGDRILVDKSVCEHESVLLEAGTHEQSLRLSVDDLVDNVKTQVADICLD